MAVYITSMNTHMEKRYYDFIARCKVTKRWKTDSYYESHHIIPRCLGGNNSRENLIKLTAREHFIAHWILAKAYGGHLWFAFNEMLNDIRGPKGEFRYKPNSRVYEMVRKHVSEEMSKKMKGRIHVIVATTGERKFIPFEDYSKNKGLYQLDTTNKGYATFKDSNGNHYHLKTNDPLIQEMGLVHYRVGYKHSDSTKKKMRENGIRDKVLITEVETGNTRFISKDEQIPDGWILGFSNEKKSEIQKTNQETFTKCKWITNGVENKRVYNYEEYLSKGWQIGRCNIGFRRKVVCEYCGKEVDAGNYGKLHKGGKCLSKCSFQWINNGERNRIIPLGAEIPIGWVKGYCIKNTKCANGKFHHGKKICEFCGKEVTKRRYLKYHESGNCNADPKINTK